MAISGQLSAVSLAFGNSSRSLMADSLVHSPFRIRHSALFWYSGEDSMAIEIGMNHGNIAKRRKRG